MLYYGLSTAVLAALLFIPVARMIWVMSVRRLERKTARTLSDDERRGQRRRARLIAALVVVPFSALFNYQIMGLSGHE